MPDQNALNTILVAVVAWYTVRSFTKLDKAIEKLFAHYDNINERFVKLESEHNICYEPLKKGHGYYKEI